MSRGLDKPIFEPKETKRPKASAKRKRVEEHDAAPSAKASRIAPAESEGAGDTSAVRRSSRNTGKTVDYKAEHHGGPPVPISFKSGVRNTENAGPLGREGGSKRVHDP